MIKNGSTSLRILISGVLCCLIATHSGCAQFVGQLISDSIHRDETPRERRIRKQRDFLNRHQRERVRENIENYNWARTYESNPYEQISVDDW